jgi:predicted alpha/beta superfamily hydrolase
MERFEIPDSKFKMYKYLLLLLLISACIAPTKKEPGDIIVAYPSTSDSFLVRVTNLATNARAGDTIHFVYYADGSLKSGKQMQEMQDKYKEKLLRKNYVFVSFAHFGNYRIKRRRDFIPPSVKTEKGYEGVSGNYGQSDSFYCFLKNTIMPIAEEKFSGNPIKRSFAGHSLGGLFATYLLVNGDSLFSDIYALSPSLWVDSYHILDYESLHQNKLRSVSKKIRISCGSRETFNKVKGGVERFGDTLSKRNYPFINYEIKMYPGKTHNSSVGPALDDIFNFF